ncbi:inner membrane protein [Roseomonas rosea]|uniref:Inner membrane protein n=2 Tax=Muricoccus roseus TaxID=198092 RepID=A0A1M6NI45_9PROT|nr:inner membrane protein [Roseomonas rosea]
MALEHWPFPPDQKDDAVPMSDTPRTPPNAPRPRGSSSSGNQAKGSKAGAASGTAAPMAAPEVKGAGETSSPASVASAAEMTQDTPPPATGGAASGTPAAASAEAAAPSAGVSSGASTPSGGARVSQPMPASPPAPPPPAQTRARRFEPAILPIAAGLVVLVGATAYLVSSPRERQAPAAVQQAEAARDAAIDRRLAALEARPAAEGLADRATAAERRLDAAETTARELAARPMVDSEARSGVTAATEALRRIEERANALESRMQEEARRAEARIAQAEATLANRMTGAEQALAARVTAAEQAFAPRLAALDAALNQRVEAAGQSMTQRMDAAGRSMDERLSRAEAEMNQRVARQEQQLAERVQQFERRLAQAEAAERRLGALAARGAIQTALEAGRPLGQALSGLSGTPPVALARYREAAPPTEAALRLSFEDAARTARLAAEPQGQSVTDSALARLQGLVTVRRGDQVVVGDAVSGELERARRSLDAGDLPGAVERLERLPEPSRNAMAGWIGQARDLVEARAALRDLGTSGAATGSTSGAGSN